jgi:hypothetical protein
VDITADTINSLGFLSNAFTLVANDVNQAEILEARSDELDQNQNATTLGFDSDEISNYDASSFAYDADFSVDPLESQDDWADESVNMNLDLDGMLTNDPSGFDAVVQDFANVTGEDTSSLYSMNDDLQQAVADQAPIMMDHDAVAQAVAADIAKDMSNFAQSLSTIQSLYDHAAPPDNIPVDPSDKKAQSYQTLIAKIAGAGATVLGNGQAQGAAGSIIGNAVADWIQDDINAINSQIGNAQAAQAGLPH